MSDPRFPIGRFSPPQEFTPELRREFIHQIAEAPTHVREAVKGLGAAQLRTPYRDGGWTVAQVVHHLGDSHMNAYIRGKLAVTETEPTIKPYDEKLWAELPDARDTEIENALALLESLHRRWAAFLAGLEDADFSRKVIHPERGPMTIDWQLSLYAWHGRHHVAHITALRHGKGW